MKDKHSIINILKLFTSFFIFFESSSIKNLLIYIFRIKKQTPGVLTALSFGVNLIILMFLFIIFRKDIIKEFKIYKENISNNIDIGLKYWMLGLAGMMISNIMITFILNGGGASNEQAVQKMINSAPLFMIINAGILAPINEELLFRKNFRNIFKNNILFILTSGIFFGYMHVAGSTNLIQWLYIIPYSSLGISFAIMYKKTNTIFTSITMHAIHNTILTLLSILI